MGEEAARMDALFTYTTLGTLGGAVAATALLVTAMRGLPGVRALPLRLRASVAAWLVLFGVWAAC